ncbi:restriction endonuclease subunit S [Vibrio aestuarianus]|uniref:restriction endonuclease subunit S n=1 Tax=Vibrio aestuarianus TaxID=28171 RepID=UPI00237CCE92|nr:restriction endonuclease subunit S [Vibrio aestuarianus]MDE1350055.1 restriction endonuclease subunit S [Vibrio aestuarianus]
MHQNSPYTLTKIGSLIDLLSGFAFKSNEFSDVATTEQHIRLLRGINITENAIRNNDTIDKFWLNSSTDLDKYYLEEGDLVISMDGSKVGRNYALVSPKDLPSLLVQRVARIRAKKGLHLPFLHQLIGSKLFTDYVDSVKTSSGIPHISAKQIKEFSIPLPNIAIQKKIAEILSTVDKKIDLIDQKIAETEKLKTGLMQKLFSEGIGVQDSDGNWQPHSEFQDSPFGKIPSMWNLNKLSTYCSIIAGVSPSKLNLNESEGYPFFKVEEFNYSKKLLTKSRNYVSNQASCHTGEFLLLPKRGAAIFLNKLRLAKGTFQIDTNVMGISFDEEVANLDFMLYRLLFERLESIADISTIPQINNKHINPYTIPLPPLGEQQQIAQIISSVFEKIDLLEQQKTETQQLKKGLMQKLLTGEWRVPLDNPEAA